MTATSHPIVDGYTSAINDQSLPSIAALFADDATLIHPIGTYEGREQISGFYRDVVLAGRAVVAAGDVLAHDDLVMAEIVATSPLDPAAGQAHAVDVFRLDAQGRIASLEIYYR